MRLDEYQWSRNPRGLHVQRVLITPLDFARWSEPKFGWVKLVAAQDEYVDDAERFLSMGITPVVRLYVERPGAMAFNAGLRSLTDHYISAGVKWFEFYNEPNLGIEWPEGNDPDWRNLDGMIRPLMENWLVWAEYIVSRGCYPGFIPLAESDDPKYSSVRWMDAFLNYMAQNRMERFRAVMGNGMYVATHPYTLNHFYQEGSGGALTARPPQAQNAREGGWHFEYPYDPISQANDPGRTVFGGTGHTPNGDPVGLIAMGRMFNERAAAMFGGGNVPVLGTEGGIFPFRDGSHQQDARYPAYNDQSQAQATVAMFDWIATQAPPWFFGVCLWKEDEYYAQDYTAPAINLLRGTTPAHKTVPALEVMSSGFSPIPLGADGLPLREPGPIHGQANYHMILLAPGLDTSWFFDTAQAYWNLFRPVVTMRTEIIDLIDYRYSLAVTVIAQPEMVDTMTSAIQQRYGNVWFDLVVADDKQRVMSLFNERVRLNRRFG